MRERDTRRAALRCVGALGRRVQSSAEDALNRLLSLEAQPAASAHEYAGVARELAAAVRSGEGARAKVAAWLVEALELRAPDGSDWEGWREARWDSMADMVSNGPGLAQFLETVADRVEARRPSRLNLLSLLRARIVWRARDRMRRRATVRARCAVDGPEAVVRGAQSRWMAGLVVQRVGEHLREIPGALTALERLLQGETVAEAARGSGLSRQQIYRILAKARRWIEAGE